MNRDGLPGTVTHAFYDMAATGTAERFDSKVLAFLHLGLIVGTGHGNCLGTMNTVRRDRVAGDVVDRFD